MNTLDALDAQSLRSDIPAFRPGDTLKVHVRVCLLYTSPSPRDS